MSRSRTRLIQISPELLLDALRVSKYIIEDQIVSRDEPIPDDVTLAGAWMDKDIIVLKVRSESFSDVLPGSAIPPWDLHWRSHRIEREDEYLVHADYCEEHSDPMIQYVGDLLRSKRVFDAPSDAPGVDLHAGSSFTAHVMGMTGQVYVRDVSVRVDSDTPRATATVDVSLAMVEGGVIHWSG